MTIEESMPFGAGTGVPEPLPETPRLANGDAPHAQADGVDGERPHSAVGVDRASFCPLDDSDADDETLRPSDFVWDVREPDRSLRVYARLRRAAESTHTHTPAPARTLPEREASLSSLSPVSPPPISPFADPAQAERFYRLGAPMDPREAGPFKPLPMWRQITRFKHARAGSLTQRRDGLGRLVLWVTNWLAALVHDRGGTPPDPRWEPTRELAEVLGISEGHLNRLCRENNGASAREIWDKLRFGTFLERLRAEIERMLEGRSFTPAPKNRKPDRFAQLLTALRSARREEGWTRLAFAWQMGFSHFARLNLAAFRTQKKSVQALEAEILRTLAATWHFDDQRCIISRERPAASQGEAQTPPLASSAEAAPQEEAPLAKTNAPLEAESLDGDGGNCGDGGDSAPKLPRKPAPPPKPQRKHYPPVEPHPYLAVHRPPVEQGPPRRFTEGRPDLRPYLPKLRGRKQCEARTETGSVVRVFAGAEEVWKYLLMSGFYDDQVEAFARSEQRSLDAFLASYVEHGMVITYPLQLSLLMPNA